MALLAAWDYKCYWCKRPTDYGHIEVDHTIPQDARDTAEGRAILKSLGVPADFDLDGLLNLGPICGDCNKEKSDAFYEEAPRFLSLRTAVARSSAEVETKYRTLQRAPKTWKLFLQANDLDYNETATLDAMNEFGPGLMRQWDSLDVQFASKAGSVDLPDAFYESVVQCELTPNARAFEWFLREQTGITWAALRESVASTVVSEISRYLRDQAERKFGGQNVKVSIAHLKVRAVFDVDDPDLFARDPRVSVASKLTLSGECEIQHIITNDSGDGTREHKFSGFLAGSASLSVEVELDFIENRASLYDPFLDEKGLVVEWDAVDVLED